MEYRITDGMNVLQWFRLGERGVGGHCEQWREEKLCSRYIMWEESTLSFRKAKNKTEINSDKDKI